MDPIRAAVVGATGTVGQRFIQLLSDHPWFEVTDLAASERSAGKTYAEATQWAIDAPMPDGVGAMTVKDAGADPDADVVFSAIPGGLAGPMERDYAARGLKVFSNARDNRRADGIPLVITEVNPEHFDMLEERKTDGYVVTNGNCSGIVATLPMHPLHEAFGIEAAHVVTMQALSGAGWPGVPSMQITDNLVPFIGGEEDKVETEPLHVLGRYSGNGKVTPAAFRISATCTRVPVLEGHSMALHLKLKGSPSTDDVVKTLSAYRGKTAGLGLPSAPERPVVYTDMADRPQPRRDRDAGKGMSVTVGRVRADPLMTVKCFVSGSNTIRGAAGQSVLNAEYLIKKGLL
ncbi:MAG: aspartate-semialdehyde dehydrogenase [Euryarchaeota archaeon]|nr:aspartate-semialdehyde dehydrogenase [Euryarchaeota archaeon]